MLAIGLSWRQALPAIVVAYCITAVPILLTGTIGTRLRVPFSVLSRSSFGFWFSYFPVITRGIIAMSWFGIQTYNGSECIYQVHYLSRRNVMFQQHNLSDAEGHMAVYRPYLKSHTGLVKHYQRMMCYLLYWLLQFPFMLLSPQKIRYLFMIKGVIVPFAWLAMVIWAFIKVPPSVGLFSQHAAVQGSDLSWAWLTALNTDFTRYATHERAQYSQAIIIPVAFTLCSFAGLALINQWDNRAAAFFASFAFLLTTIGTNISANALVAANDLTVCFPKYINIRRGQVICAFIGGWAFCPWEVLAKASGFLSFLSGYTIFIGPFIGIMIVDYWLIHQGKIDVPAMYQVNGRYRYTYGVNWRALATLVICIAPAMPGLIHSIKPSINVGGIHNLFAIGWIFGFWSAFVVYYALSTLFPARGTYVEKAVLPDDVIPPSTSCDSTDEDVEKLDKAHVTPGTVS
ncbi:permease for cytosine/purines, uracil, thiamine, allantoin-domain-containing protein [Suillus subaureus]|uniref:Permease for cytosine/purines, uracil, thiamine, allantoin-domain-containing protein n=1 Tax=Suillus subaureus TaxID=48587 RepID=A0A9P7JAY9_9AGAM|nr:permease for cytosine/purines, uracil, thiamine, allantoin-domain-containing protein [Suillus subaureus]KAG1811758.1 permease for cytosine/purines, uracil, thiamine, allantoin-domain-containing protein [Suillus subaureus]